MNFTRSYTSTDGNLVKISTLIHSIVVVESSPGLPAAGPKCAMVSDCVSESICSSKKRYSLLPAMAQKRDWGKWRVVGWRENNIIKDLVCINDIRTRWVCFFGTHHLLGEYCYSIILKMRKVRLHICFYYPSSIWWALTTVKEPWTLRHDRWLESGVSHSAVMLVHEAPQNTLFPWPEAPRSRRNWQCSCPSCLLLLPAPSWMKWTWCQDWEQHFKWLHWKQVLRIALGSQQRQVHLAATKRGRLHTAPQDGYESREQAAEQGASFFPWNMTSIGSGGGETNIHIHTHSRVNTTLPLACHLFWQFSWDLRFLSAEKMFEGLKVSQVYSITCLVPGT